MNREVDELFPVKPLRSLRIYAYKIPNKSHKGLIKVGQTTREVKKRIEEQLKTVAITDYEILLDELGYRDDGSHLTDHQLRAHLKKKGFSNPKGEWMKCSLTDIKVALSELKSGVFTAGSHHLTFKMRPEQEEAVNKTKQHFHSIWHEDMNATPRFLWNAKMRFGKTFASYQLAKKMGAKRVLVVTFKPAVADSWQNDLESHKDFIGWQFMSRHTNSNPTEIDALNPVVYFGSFQDLLGRDKYGNIKSKNKWLHLVQWDLVIFDEYHFGAWRETAKELFDGEESTESKKEISAEFSIDLDKINEMIGELKINENEVFPITSRAYLYLSGTPFRAIATGEFIEEQIFNWTYTDEQMAKKSYSLENPESWNPYATLPEMRLLTYQMPDELLAVANMGEFDEFDLNTFFAASGNEENARFDHESEVQKWLNIIRGGDSALSIELMNVGQKPPFPYSDVRLLPYMQHSFWFMPNVASCHAMANLLSTKSNIFWHDYQIIVAAGPSAGIGLKALPPVRNAIGPGIKTKTITLSCGKLTTGVTVKQWTSILMLRNLKSPETYFQAAFRVQSPWAISNPNGDDPHQVDIIKPACFVFDFAPTRALRQISEYGIGLAPNESNPENAVRDLVSFLPVLAFDGANMTQIDAGGILDIAMSGTSATLLARKWESALLVNVDNGTLSRILGNEDAMVAIGKIEGWRNLGDNILETIINSSNKVKDIKSKAKEGKLSNKEKKQLTDAEKEYKSKRKLVQQKLIKFATRIPAFMYLTDFRENTLQDVITKLEPQLFQTVTGLTIDDFQLLVTLRVFNTELMNQAVFAFRRYEDSSLSYTGIDSHEGLTRYGLFDTVIAKEK